jgi:hypothetical protein
VNFAALSPWHCRTRVVQRRIIVDPTGPEHGAPAICTLSGSSLFKLYRHTGRKLYLEMIQELAHNLPPYLSRSDRPVGEIPAGWMNERVQLREWLEPIGEIFFESTWPEVSNMLT